MKDEDYTNNLRSLEELILDENKVVTCTSLSKELCIHVNSCKFLLTSFIEKISKKSDVKLNVMYILSGLINGNNAKTIICPLEELEESKQQFQELFYEHIYSVSKGTVDKVAFNLLTKFEDFSLCLGLIKNGNCSKRSSSEIDNLKINSQAKLNHQEMPAKKTSSNGLSISSNKKIKECDKVTHTVQQTTKIAIDSSKKNQVPFPKMHEVTSSKTNGITSPKTNGITSPKTNGITSPKKNGASNSKAKPEAKHQKGITGFFSKQNGPSTKKPATDSMPVKTEALKITAKPVVKDEPVVKSEKMDVDEEIKVITNGTKSDSKKESQSKPKNKSLTNIKKNAKIDKKRKRVLHVSDSESDTEKDDIFVDDTPMETHESEDEIPPTPNVSTVKITSGIVNPKKRRKIVDKTYTDEDGYILTKKEEVYESCSDNDEVDSKENVIVNPIKKDASPKEIKVTQTKNTKKKISPPQKGKQATMMNFFKKV